ncbi:PREDICTED: endocuticle structural glycoprotein SgAbd-5-like [Nicrophorus vespilloides]|uniref:Endocuticle structural glycoprotein SgAbd-5-like n=1 Tax=Nicrophorus vespilloides TaxID=110193 RepID=A0ABM1N8H5_NICVS|nr:PREDICTED: endocuticle structural glycoprotein SgAbd-5-like [Nicrophorus vespilloides]
MKTLLLVLSVVGVCLARPQGGKDATIVRYESENGGAIDGYKFGFETSDGTKRDEEGTLKDLGGTEGPAIVIKGSFTWTDPESGQTFTINFVADENGYQPEGAHLPK